MNNWYKIINNNNIDMIKKSCIIYHMKVSQNKNITLIEMLRSGKTPEEIKELYKINFKRHPEYPNLILFKYNQIESPMSEKLVQEARGIILDENNNWNPVSYPFNKFFNYNEPNAHDIDWESAKIYEKLDGSLIQLYYYNNEWKVATSGSPDAGGPVNSFSKKPFKELVWEVWDNLNYQFPYPEDQNKTFMFELQTALNQVVVTHAVSKMDLIGVRNNETLEEEDPEIYSKKYNWNAVKTFPLKNLEDVLKTVQQLNPFEQEGYVVRDENFNRVKIKSPLYVLEHHGAEKTNEDLIRIVLDNEVNEVMGYFPKYGPILLELQKAINKAKKEVQKDWNKYKNIENRKEFALNVIKKPYSSLLFALKDNKYKDVNDAFNNAKEKYIDKLIKPYLNLDNIIKNNE